MKSSNIDPGRKNCQDDQEVVFTLGYKERKNVTEMPESERYRAGVQSVAPQYTLQGGLLKIAAAACIVFGMAISGTCSKANKSVHNYENKAEQARIESVQDTNPELLQIWNSWENEAKEK